MRTEYRVGRRCKPCDLGGIANRLDSHPRRQRTVEAASAEAGVLVLSRSLYLEAACFFRFLSFVINAATGPLSFYIK